MSARPITSGGKGTYIPPFTSPTSPHALTTTDLTHTDRLAPTATLLASVFATDPVITWLLSSLPSAAARQAYLPTYFHTLLKAAALNNAVFDEIDGWKCRMLLEFEPQTKAMRAKVLPKGEKHYYVFFIGTRENAQGQGLGSELMRHQQDVVRESGLPIWLEATTARSRDLYARLGFEVVDEILLGRGDVGAEGLPEKGGAGVPVWGMVWWPQEGRKGISGSGILGGTAVDE